jgi:hypothetical protein
MSIYSKSKKLKSINCGFEQYGNVNKEGQFTRCKDQNTLRMLILDEIKSFKHAIEHERKLIHQYIQRKAKST